MTNYTVTAEWIKIQELEDRIEKLEAILKPKQSPVRKLPETHVAYATFDNNHERDCLKLYTMVTGQPAPPNNQIDTILSDMSPILDHYHSIDAAIPDGKRVFARWCSTQGKSGKPYSAVNAGWLGWWLDEIAPRPEQQGTSVEERLASMFGGAK